MTRGVGTLRLLVICALVFLSGCKEDPKERADRHYQSALELLESGDEARALVEFRNALKYDGAHKDARLTYATLRWESGAIEEAYSQFLRLKEQYPELPEAHIALGQIAVEYGLWDAAADHAESMVEFAPQAAETALVGAAVRFHSSLSARNADEAPGIREGAAEIAAEVLANDRTNIVAWRILIDRALLDKDATQALDQVKAALAANPDHYEFHLIRLRLLEAAAAREEMRAALAELTEVFPDSAEARDLRLTWARRHGDLAEAELFLRSLAAAPEATIDDQLAVVQFLSETQGVESALDELRQLRAKHPEDRTLRAVEANFNFEAGQEAQAVTAMRALVEEQAADTETAELRLLLSRMLIETGDVSGARAEVAQVLDHDPTQVEALKMRAAWQIRDGDVADAILNLRAAQAGAPRDPEIMLLLAEAHLMTGDRNLAGDRFALAVEFANRAPAVSLRYAAFLVEENRIDAALAVLSDARRRAPDHVGIMTAQADLLLRSNRFDEVENILAALSAAETDAAGNAASAIQTTLMLAKGRVEEALALQDSALTQGTDGELRTALNRLQILFRSGRYEEAQEALTQELEKYPGNNNLLFVQASLFLAQGKTDAARPLLESLVQKNPDNGTALQALFGLMSAQGRGAETRPFLIALIDNNPDAIAPRLAMAALLEQEQDYEGAIDAYEALYNRLPGNPLFANNLASLLSQHRNDAESLRRAQEVAQVLRGSRVPAFQDTYGWISFLNGNVDEAIRNLEPAAAGLADDALVRYHLGKAYIAAGRLLEARREMTEVLALVDTDASEIAEEARAFLNSDSGTSD